MIAAMSSPVPRFLLLLLLAAAFAGCASNEDAPGGDVTDEPDGERDEGAAPTPTPTPAGEGEVDDAERIGLAFERIDSTPGHFLVTIQHYDGSLARPDAGTDALYVDSANGTTYYRFNGSKDDRAGQVGSVIVQMSESNRSVYAVRAPELGNFTTVANFSQLALGAKLPLALAYYPTAQYMFLQRAFYSPSFSPAVDEDASGDGRLRIQYGNPTSTSTTLVVDQAHRLYWLNATQASGGVVSKWGNASVVYGLAASNDPEVEKMRRAASMAFLDAPTLNAAQRGENETNATTWTVVSDVPALVDLEDAQLRVFDRGDAGEETPRLALSLADGAAENAQLALAFVDADADGKVSAGDTFTVEVKSARDSVYDVDVRLTDLTTGWELATR